VIPHAPASYKNGEGSVRGQDRLLIQQNPRQPGGFCGLSASSTVAGQGCFLLLFAFVGCHRIYGIDAGLGDSLTRARQRSVILQVLWHDDRVLK
jgi:hypothetical protein